MNIELTDDQKKEAEVFVKLVKYYESQGCEIDKAYYFALRDMGGKG